MDRLELAAQIGQAAPATDMDATHVQPSEHPEASLPGGDTVTQIDEFGLRSFPSDQAAASGVPAADSGVSPQVAEQNSRWQAANTQKAQELAREKQLIDSDRQAFNAERQAYAMQLQAAQEPSRGPVPFSERLAQTHPNVKETMTPEALALFDSIGDNIREETAPYAEELQTLRDQVSVMGQQLKVSGEQQHARSVLDEGRHLQATYGAENVKHFMPTVLQKMAQAPGLSLTDAFQLAAGSWIQKSAVSQATVAARAEHARQLEGGVLERGNGPGSSAIPARKANETSYETALRNGLIRPME